MKEYILKPIMTPATVALTTSPDKSAVVKIIPPRQPLPTATIDPAKPMLKLGSGDFHEKAVMSKKLTHCFLVGRRIVGKAGVDLASIRTRSPERFTIGSDVLAEGV